MSEGSQREAINTGTEKQPQLDAARETHLIPDGDLDCEEVVNNARKNRRRERGPQRGRAESPNQPTRTVQAGGGLMQVICLKSK